MRGPPRPRGTPVHTIPPVHTISIVGGQKSSLDAMLQEFKAEAEEDLQRRIQAHNLPPLLPYDPIPLPDSIQHDLPEPNRLPHPFLPPSLNIHQDVDSSVWDGPMGTLYRSRVSQSSETGGDLYNDPIVVEDDVDIVSEIVTCLAYRPRHGGYTL